MIDKKRIVISAINIRSGGTLSILRDCLAYLNKYLTKQYEIIALVHRKSLVKDFGNIKFVEFPLSIKSYLLRCYYEYFYFYKLSKRIKPYLWLSLHDMTPNVKADIRAVYCHNPSPFYNFKKLADMLLEPTFTLFTWFYKYLYKINIEKNDYVIVQQSWLKDKFMSLFHLENDKVIVAHPNFEKSSDFMQHPKQIVKHKSDYVFFYPSFPRVFKNFEIICEAAKKLQLRGGKKIEFILTIDGSENKYSKRIFEKYKYLSNVSFIGLQSREKVCELYENSDCLIFPSKLETWGMPLMEAKAYGLPIIAADLPYAHESVGKYEKVSFFDTDSPEDLVIKIKEMSMKRYTNHVFELADKCCFENWESLFVKLLGE